MEHKKIYRYLGAVGIALVMAVGLAFAQGITSVESAVDLFALLTDCFTLPGILFAGMGGLSLISYHGGYDSLSYMFSRYGLHNLIPTYQKNRQYETLYEYKQKKDAKGRSWHPEWLFVGLGCLVLSFAMLIGYFALS